MLHCLTYTSAAVREMTNDDLVHILTTSRAYNDEFGLTGMLLYHNRSFLQALEGDKQEIYDVLDNRIVADNRHTGIYVLREYELPKRNFRKWSMGFHNLDKSTKESLNGFTDFLTDGFTSEVVRNDIDRAQRLLLNFRKMI